MSGSPPQSVDSKVQSHSAKESSHDTPPAQSSPTGGPSTLGGVATAFDLTSPERWEEIYSDTEDEEPIYVSASGLFTQRQPPAGSRPGTLVIPEGADPPRLRAFLYDSEGLEERALSNVTEVPALLTDRRPCWVDVQGIGDENTLLELQRLFFLHPLALEDAVNAGHRPSSQVYGNHHLVIARAPRLDTKPGELQFEQLSFFVGERTLLTIQEHHGDEFHGVVERLRQGKGPIRSSGIDYLAYALIDAVVDQYFPLMEEMGDFLERLERDVIRRPEASVLGEVNRAKKELLMSRRALWPQRDMVAGLIRDESPFFTDITRVYLRDVLDHCAQLLDVVETYREVASGLMSTYLSAVGNRTNEVMKVLTMISTIFIPLSFVAGIYGMNFPHMPEMGWRWSYPVVLAAMAIAALGMMVFFVRRGWIGQDLRRWYLARRRLRHLRRI